jgi:hypothetical protein
MSRTRMSRTTVSRPGVSWAWFAPICIAALGVLPAGGARAQQNDQSYETPQYDSQGTSTLDKNYGLPTFGMPGADMPRQRTMAPEKEAPDRPDALAGSSSITLPTRRPSASARPDSETPLYTTPEGSTTGDTTSSTSDGTTSSSTTSSQGEALR